MTPAIVDSTGPCWATRSHRSGGSARAGTQKSSVNSLVMPLATRGILRDAGRIQMPLGQPSLSFLSNARRGLNEWWRWLLGIFLILFMWIGIGSIPFLTACQYLQDSGISQFQCNGTQISGDSVIPNYILQHYGFIIGIIGIWIAVRLVHKKPLTQVVTGRKTFDYNRVMYAIWAGLLVNAVLLLLDAVFVRSEIVFRSPSISEYVTFFLLAIVLTTYQAGFEEVFFRGYLLQGMSLLVRNRFTLVIASSLLFMSVHLSNPEPYAYGFAPYISSLVLFGLFMTTIVLIDGGIELAVGYHALNNLWIGLVANTEISAMQSPSLFLVPMEGYELFPDIPVQLIAYVVLFIILNKKYKWITLKTLLRIGAN